MKLDWQHWAIVLGFTFLGGAAGYAEAPHPSEAWKYLCLHAVGAGIAAVVALLKRSPLSSPETLDQPEIQKSAAANLAAHTLTEREALEVIAEQEKKP